VVRPAWLVQPEGLIPYESANDTMHALAEDRLRGLIPDTVILLEHPPVFTAGRRASPEELLWPPDELAAKGAQVHRIDRGGSFTFHGPGQLVGYPILDLGSTPDAAQHMRRMEEAVILAASDVGVRLHRRTDVQTGVWHGDDKVAAIGVRLMRARVSLHGFALNCDTDLSWFGGIVACGLPDNGVTSLSRIADRDVTVAQMRPILVRRIAEVFDLSFDPAPMEAVARLQPAPARR
jgi:lipoyl(octanoyl) transferase